MDQGYHRGFTVLTDCRAPHALQRSTPCFSQPKLVSNAPLVALCSNASEAFVIVSGSWKPCYRRATEG